MTVVVMLVVLGNGGRVRSLTSLCLRAASPVCTRLHRSNLVSALKVWKFGTQPYCSESYMLGHPVSVASLFLGQQGELL